MRSFLTTTILALAIVATIPRVANAEVRRCVAPDGQVLFTDRKCGEVGAEERPRIVEPSGTGIASRRWTCARTVQDLVFEMTTAIESGDANRLAGVYHWPGISATAAHAIWQRLDAIANRPLVDIVPVLPSAAGSVLARAEAEPATGDFANGAGAHSPPQPDPQLYPQTAVRRTPVALRLEQTQRNAATPARTVLDLTRHFGCWWVRF